MSDTVNVIINNAALAALHKVAAGAIVSVAVKQGVPVNREWRNRFKDAEFDNCISIEQPAPPKAKKKEAE